VRCFVVAGFLLTIASRGPCHSRASCLKGRSTVTQLLQILDDWTETLESGGRIDVIYIDFEKALDKVAHRRLLSKLKSYKLHTSIIAWIKNFLTDRKQRVRVNGEFLPCDALLSATPSSCVCLSVCLCVCVCVWVCLSHSGIVSKRLNFGSRR